MKLLCSLSSDPDPSSAPRHCIAHYVPHQRAILALRTRGAPTYQQRGGARAGAFNLLRGGGWLCAGREERIRREGGETKKRKDGKEKKKMIKGNKLN